MRNRYLLHSARSRITFFCRPNTNVRAESARPLERAGPATAGRLPQAQRSPTSAPVCSIFALCLIASLIAGCGAPSPAVQPIVGSPAPTSPLLTDTPAPAMPTDRPAIVARVPLGLAWDAWLYSRPLAVDPTSGQVYISGTPNQTVALGRDLNIERTLDAGGNLTLDPVNNRLFIGAADRLIVYSTRSGSRLTDIALDTPRDDAASQIPHLPIAPLADAQGNVYAIQQGLHRINAVGLYATVILDQPRDIRAIWLDESHNVLYASVNNGIPGSNNRNDLWRVELGSRRLVPLVSGVRDLVVDQSHQRLIIATARFGAPGALQVWSGAPLTLTHSVANLSGQLALDADRDRLYVLTSDHLLALQASTLALIADVDLGGNFAALTLDPAADRLYLLSVEGELLVMTGRGGSPPPTRSIQTVSPPVAAVTRLVASPDVTRDKTLVGIWGAALPQGGQLFLSHDNGATWQQVSGGLPPAVTDAVFSPNYLNDATLFAATQRGVYRSTDGGASWQPASAGLQDVWVVQLAISPAAAREPVLYARTLTGGLHRSADGGSSWTSLANNYAAQPGERTTALAVSPDFEQDRTVFLGVSRGGGLLLFSNDDGQSWIPLANAAITAIAPSPAFARDRTIWGVFGQQGLMRSTDGGVTWQSAQRGLPALVQANSSLVLSADAALLLMRNPPQLYRTSDGGESWQISQAAFITQTSALALAGQTVWLGTQHGQVLTASLDALAWARVAVTLRGQLEALALSPAFNRDGTLYVAGKESGVWASYDGGKTWQDTGFPAREAGSGRMHLAISPDFARDRTVFAATGSQVYRSTDAGNTWQILPVGPGNVFPLNDLDVSPNYARDRTLMIAGDYRAPTVLRSTDGGEMWQADASGLPASGGLSHLTFSPNYAADRGVYVWTESEGLYRSGDGGQSWSRVYKPQGGWLVQSFALSPDFGRDRLMFLGTLKENHNVYRSADGGASWHPAELGLPLELVWASALALSPQFGRDRTIFLGTDAGVYRSTDGGQLWRIAANLPQVVALAISASPDGHHIILALSISEGLYISTDGGEQWQKSL